MGHKNPLYGNKLVNFMLALSGQNMTALNFVSANLSLASPRHIQRMSSARRGTPIVLRSMKEIHSLISQRIKIIRERSGDPSRRVAFTLGIDGTVLVKGWQHLATERKVVGGAFPNDCHDVANLSKEQLVSFLQDCLDGKNGILAGEVKIAIVNFQDTPTGMSPSVILAGLNQTINHSNNWGAQVLAACVSAAASDHNAVVLNESTDGVSCETKWNYTQIIKYLGGETNVLSFPDTNHNVKNLRYQLIGGSSAASIGRYTFDPWLLKEATDVPKALVRVDDYASDAVAIGLGSARVVNSIAALNSEDAGNSLVS